MLKKTVFLTGLGLCAVSEFFVAKAAHANEEIIITPSRVSTPIRQVGSSVSVLNAEDIAAYGQTTVADLLRRLPSVGVSNSGGLGKNTSLRIRGEESFRTKVLVDGVDISDPTNPQIQAQFQHLLTTDIERIEVLRGPQGMMYGADSGGVVQIFTKKAQTPFQGDVVAEYGRYNSRLGAASIRGQQNNFDYALSVANLGTHGFNARVDDTVAADTDGYENTSTGLNLGYKLSDTWRISTAFRNVTADDEFDNCYDSSFTNTQWCQDSFNQTNTKIAAQYQDAVMSHTFSYALAQTDSQHLAKGVDTTFDVKGELDQLQYLGSYAFNKSSQVVYGLDAEQQSSQDAQQKSNRNQTGTYVELQQQWFERYFFTLGTRYDDNEDFGTHLSYRLTSAYLLPVNNDTLKFKGSYGTGFRAPSLFEIYYNNSSSAFPPASNTTLREEDSKGFDLGFEYLADSGLKLELVYFNQRIANAIYFDLANYSGYLQESGQSDSQGVELSFDLPLNPIYSVYGNYTYNDTEDAEGKQRIRRPRNTLVLGANIYFPGDKWRLSVDARQVTGSVDEVYLLGRQALEDYSLMNMNLNYTVHRNWEIYLRGENIFNDSYQEVLYYNTSGAAFYTGVRGHF